MNWRIFPDEIHSGAENFAIDEAIANHGQPSMRTFGWKKHAVSYGCAQDISDINVAYAKSAGIDLCRRPTAGYGVDHPESGSRKSGDVSYSVIAPLKWFQEKYKTRGRTPSYDIICGWIANAVRGLGFDAKVEKWGSILVDGKKVAGNSLNLYHGDAGHVIFVEGSLWYRLDLDSWAATMKMDPAKAREKMTDLHSRRELDREEVVIALHQAFAGAAGDFEDGYLSQDENAHVERLLGVYTSDQWNLDSQRPDGAYLTKSKGSCGTEW